MPGFAKAVMRAKSGVALRFPSQSKARFVKLQRRLKLLDFTLLSRRTVV